MNEIEQINHRLLFILGASLPLIMGHKSTSSHEERLKNWVIEAIEKVVYKNEELPELKNA